MPPKKNLDLKLDPRNSDDWVDIFNNCENDLNKAKERINERNKKAKVGQDTPVQNAQIRKMFNEINRDIRDLRDALKYIIHEISEKEIARRKSDLDSLEQDKHAAEKLFQKNDTSARAKLYGAVDPDDIEIDADSLKQVQAKEVLDVQNKIMDHQDKNVEKLSAALDKTKQISLGIGDQLDEHSVLLGELDSDVSKTDRNVRKQTRRVDQLLKSAKIPFAICCIVVLIIIICVLLFLALYFGPIGK